MTIRVGDIIRDTVGPGTANEELAKIFLYMYRNINELTEDNIEILNTGNLLGYDGVLFKQYDPIDVSTEQYSGYLGGALGSGSWLDRIYNDVQEVVNR